MIYNVSLPDGVLNFALSQDNEKYIIGFTISIAEIYNKVKSEFIDADIVGKEYLQTVGMKFRATVLVNGNQIWKSWNNETGNAQFKDLNTNSDIIVSNIDIKDKLLEDDIKQKIKCNFEISHPGFYINFDSQEYTFLCVKRKPTGLLQLQRSGATTNTAIAFKDLNSTIEGTMTDNDWLVFNQGNRYQTFVVPLKYDNSGFIKFRNNKRALLETNPNNKRVSFRDSFRRSTREFNRTNLYEIVDGSRYSLDSTGLDQSDYLTERGNVDFPLTSYDSSRDWTYNYSYNGWRKDPVTWSYKYAGEPIFNSTGAEISNVDPNDLPPEEDLPFRWYIYTPQMQQIITYGTEETHYNRVFRWEPSWYYTKTSVNGDTPKYEWYIHNESIPDFGRTYHQLPDATKYYVYFVRSYLLTQRQINDLSNTRQYQGGYLSSSYIQGSIEIPRFYTFDIFVTGNMGATYESHINEHFNVDVEEGVYEYGNGPNYAAKGFEVSKVAAYTYKYVPVTIYYAEQVTKRTYYEPDSGSYYVFLDGYTNGSTSIPSVRVYLSHWDDADGHYENSYNRSLSVGYNEVGSTAWDVSTGTSNTGPFPATPVRYYTIYSVDANKYSYYGSDVNQGGGSSSWAFSNYTNNSTQIPRITIYTAGTNQGGTYSYRSDPINLQEGYHDFSGDTRFTDYYNPTDTFSRMGGIVVKRFVVEENSRFYFIYNVTPNPPPANTQYGYSSSGLGSYYFISHFMSFDYDGYNNYSLPILNMRDYVTGGGGSSSGTGSGQSTYNYSTELLPIDYSRVSNLDASHYLRTNFNVQKILQYPTTGVGRFYNDIRYYNPSECSGNLRAYINEYITKPKYKDFDNWYIDGGQLRYGTRYNLKDIANYDRLYTYLYS